MARHVIGPVEDFKPGSRVRVLVGGRAVAVFNVDGSFYALRDACPHQGAALSGGKVVGAVSSEAPGCYVYDPSRALVKCPWHGWEFDLGSGRSWFDPDRERVRRYAVSVEAGSVVSERVAGPYLAETFEISVEHDYLVLEM